MSEHPSPPTPEEVPIHDRRRFTPDGELREGDAENASPTGQAAADPADGPDAPLADEGEKQSEAEERLSRALAEAEARAAQAEAKLRDYAAACDEFRREAERAGARAKQEVRDTLTPTFLGLFDALDDLERTLLHAEDGPLREGVELVHRKVLEVLASRGVERLSLAGKAFNPEFAEAVYAVEVEDEDEKGKVLEELRPGYRWNEGVLRPAQVKVGR